VYNTGTAIANTPVESRRKLPPLERFMIFFLALKFRQGNSDGEVQDKKNKITALNTKTASVFDG